MIDLARLKSTLLTSGLSQQNNPLFQVINQLLQAVRDLQEETQTSITTVSGNVTGFENLRYLTHDNDLGNLPNSRHLIAGSNITFDDTMVGQRIINATGGSPTVEGYWSLLTDGNAIEPELIFTSNGDVISTFNPL